MTDLAPADTDPFATIPNAGPPVGDTDPRAQLTLLVAVIQGFVDGVQRVMQDVTTAVTAGLGIGPDSDVPTAGSGDLADLQGYRLETMSDANLRRIVIAYGFDAPWYGSEDERTPETELRRRYPILAGLHRAIHIASRVDDEQADVNPLMIAPDSPQTAALREAYGKAMARWTEVTGAPHRQGPRPDGTWGCACGWDQDKPHADHVADMAAMDL